MSELKMSEIFRNIRMYWFGEGFYIKNGLKVNHGEKVVKTAKTQAATAYDTAEELEHRVEAVRALKKASHILLSKNPPSLLVLDEVLTALDQGLIEESVLISIMRARRRVHLVLTGRYMTDRVSRVADLVTEMRKIKHPYDKGTLAVKGLDY